MFRSIVVAALPEDVVSVTPVLGDPMPSLTSLTPSTHMVYRYACRHTKQPYVLTEHVINAMLKRNYLQSVDGT